MKKHEFSNNLVWDFGFPVESRWSIVKEVKMKQLRVLALVVFASVVIFARPGFSQQPKTVTMARTTGSIGTNLEFSTWLLERKFLR